MRLRVAAALVLFTQLHQLALPALCGAPDPSRAACGEAMSTDASGAALQPAAHRPPCASAAMCALPAAGLPLSVFSALSVTGDRRVAAPAVNPLQPGDPPTPLSPPPQA